MLGFPGWQRGMRVREVQPPGGGGARSGEGGGWLTGDPAGVRLAGSLDTPEHMLRGVAEGGRRLGRLFGEGFSTSLQHLGP